MNFLLGSKQGATKWHVYCFLKASAEIPGNISKNQNIPEPIGNQDELRWSKVDLNPLSNTKKNKASPAAGPPPAMRWKARLPRSLSFPRPSASAISPVSSAKPAFLASLKATFQSQGDDFLVDAEASTKRDWTQRNLTNSETSKWTCKWWDICCLIKNCFCFSFKSVWDPASRPLLPHRPLSLQSSYLTLPQSEPERLASLSSEITRKTSHKSSCCKWLKPNKRIFLFLTWSKLPKKV